MKNELDCDLCVIGAGAAGLSIAVGAVQLGARTVLFEKGVMGGDCLNYGCVPSKALLAAASAAQTIAKAGDFGIHTQAANVDFPAVMAHVRAVIAQIAPHDSVDRLERLGVRVINASAEFTDRDAISGGGVRVRARRFVIATGSSAAIPTIAGIEAVPVLTNETLFALNECPRHLIIIGGGPIGIEMAQAFRRLGSAVTLFERDRVLANDEPELVDVVRTHLRAAGVVMHETIDITAVSPAATGVSVRYGADGEVLGTHVLVAAGRQPRLAGLALERAGIRYTSQGITVDRQLRTSNKRIFALGDVIGPPRFTHAAAYQAGIVIRNALFRLPATVDYRALPRVTYGDPELAQIGLTERQARERYGASVQTVQTAFNENDRARTERQTTGGIKVILDKRGTILGASIVGAHAGELITLWGLAITHRMKLSALTGVIFPYPTFGELSRAAASAFYAPKLFSRWPKRLARLLLAIG